MRSVHMIFYGVALICVAILAGYSFFSYYPYIFSRRVEGVITKVDRIELNVALMQNSGEHLDPQMFSFAVGIRQDDGEILTASAEDRQWAAAQRGLCAVATYYPYPPWRLMKGGTYFNARLDKLYECPQKAANLPPLPSPATGQPAQSAPGSGQPTQAAPAAAGPAAPPMATPAPQQRQQPEKIPTH